MPTRLHAKGSCHVCSLSSLLSPLLWGTLLGPQSNVRLYQQNYCPGVIAKIHPSESWTTPGPDCHRQRIPWDMTHVRDLNILCDVWSERLGYYKSRLRYELTWCGTRSEPGGLSIPGTSRAKGVCVVFACSEASSHTCGDDFVGRSSHDGRSPRTLNRTSRRARYTRGAI